MRIQRTISFSFSLTTLWFCILVNVGPSASKSTIEPCSNSDICAALLGYTLYTDLKVSEVATLFQVDPVSLLTANSIDISYPNMENHIFPSGLFLSVPVPCSCSDSICKSVATHYKTRPSNTFSAINDSFYDRLVSTDQIKRANSISDPFVLDVGEGRERERAKQVVEEEQERDHRMSSGCRL